MQQEFLHKQGAASPPSTKRSAIFSFVREKIKRVGKSPILLNDSGNRYMNDVQEAKALAKYFRRCPFQTLLLALLLSRAVISRVF